MFSSRRVVAVLVLVMGMGMVSVPAESYPKTINVTQTNTSKTVKKFYRDWKSGGGMEVSDSDFAEGRLTLDVTPFRVVESVDKTAQFLLNIEVRNRKRLGAAPFGWANVSVTPLKKRGELSDYGVTTGKQLGSCTVADLTISASFAGIAAGSKIGEINGCGHSAVKVASRNAKTGATTWALRGLRKTRSLSLEVYIEVPAGAPPNWRVTVDRPLDSCSKADGDPRYVCTPRDIVDTTTFRVKGKG